ncbi:MAG: alpha/beta hydrolase [Chloroflexi bacterium]|nr:alpha/beta hydrolase [Chloroflexota bacterium]MDA1174997.1 alpha/beta hydrolase [Chloroflexota bacterium]
MRRKRMTRIVGALLVVAFLALGATGWYYAGEIKDGALIVEHGPSEPDLTVAALSAGQVTLAVNDRTDLIYGRWKSDGVYGIEWDGGYAQTGRIIEISADQVTRELTPVRGQLTVGMAVHMEEFAFDGDPHQAYGVPFEDVTITSEFGDFDAWLVQGDDPTWVIFTHGRGATREESHRMFRTVSDLGLTSLAITYRNDEGAPESDSGFYDYGLTEWVDLEAAVQYAVDHGAEDVVLAGYSLGAGIVMNFLYESDLADEVVAVIVDSPMLDFSDVITFGGERRGLPSLLTNTGKFVGGLRFGIDWEALDYVARADELDVPFLVFHVDNDRLIHQRSSQRFADARPDLVTFVSVAGAGHVRSWNDDHARYEAAVVDFLEDLH